MPGPYYDEGLILHARLGMERHLPGGLAPLRHDLARAEYLAEMRARRFEEAHSREALLPAGWLGRLLGAVVAVARLQVPKIEIRRFSEPHDA